jgi:hypothetical protein
VKPATACREANYSRDTVKIRDDSNSRNNKTIMDVNSSIGPPESVEKSDSKKAKEMQQQCQQHQDSSSRNSQLEHCHSRVDTSRDNRIIRDVNSRRETRNSGDASNRRDANNSSNISRDANKRERDARIAWTP